MSTLTDNTSSLHDLISSISALPKDRYEEGLAAGYDKGVTDGVEQGKQSEWDKFWDAYQDYGRRTVYNLHTGGFLGAGWTDDNFKPKYPIVPTDASYIFRQTGITDLTREDIVMDFSQCTRFGYAFAYGGNALKKIPPVDLSKAVETTSAFEDFNGDTLHLKFSESTVLTSSTLRGIRYLVNFTAEGTIAMNISLPNAALLSTESAQSIIDHLKDLTGATAQTLTLHNDVGNKLTEAQKATITAKNWTLVY